MCSSYRIIVVAVIFLAVSSVTSAGETWSGPADAYYAYAKVTDVQPIVRVVQVSTPRTVCWDEPAQYQARAPGYRSFTPAVVGGILGGIVGNQFGGGRGQTAMTVAGSLLGASIGRDAAQRNSVNAGYAYAGSGTARRCEVEEIRSEEERLDGYRVIYRFHGREYVTRMQSDPGSEIQVRVSVDPVGGG